MIEDLKELDLAQLDKLEGKEALEKLDEILKEKLGLGLAELKAPLIEFTKKNAEEFSLELPNIAPKGDFNNLIEDNEGMTEFLKNEACDPEIWAPFLIAQDETHQQLLRVVFKCLAVDEGETLRGTTFVSKSGVIRHAYVQVIT